MLAIERWLVASRCAALMLSLVLGLLAWSGCGKSGVKLYPVEGKVLFKDQPATGAQVVFQPKQASGSDAPIATEAMAYATVETDGTFKLRSASGEGAAPGEYYVMLTWYDADPRKPEKTVNKLPAKYSDQSKPALVATVKEQKNELEPFKLN